MQDQKRNRKSLLCRGVLKAALAAVRRHRRRDTGTTAFGRALVAALVCAPAPAPALAAEPQFGRWAADAQFCGSGGNTHHSAPLIVTPTTLTWASEFCAIGKMYKAGRVLYIEGRCSSGGMMARHPITLTMKREWLAVTWNGERSELKRCP